MDAYVPALIWCVSALACLVIAKRRNVRVTVVKQLAGALLGPLAIPWVLLAKPEKFLAA